MHKLFAQVLNKKDLSKAGDLFSLDDGDIKRCLNSVLQKIGEIIDNKDFASNENDQRVVDICITRVTSAIRKTESIEEHAIALVRLLELCQKHNLNPSPQEKDPPHAKIASDIMTCLFMHYGKGKVMIQAIPVVVNFLCCSNKELGRDVSSYMSLAALDNANLLARHIDLILYSLLRGNYVLSTMLPQIFTQCRQVVIDQLDRLVKIIDKCELSQRVSLFHVFGMIAKTDTKVLEKHVPKFVKYLSSNALSPMILCLFIDMATASPLTFVDHVSTLQKVAEQQPSYVVQVVQIMGALTTINKDYARRSMDYFVSQFSSADQMALTVILQEIKALSLSNHDLLALNLGEISKLSQNGSSAVRILVQQLKEDNNKYSSPAAGLITEQERSARAPSNTVGTSTSPAPGQSPEQERCARSKTVGTSTSPAPGQSPEQERCARSKTVGTSTSPAPGQSPEQERCARSNTVGTSTSPTPGQSPEQERCARSKTVGTSTSPAPGQSPEQERCAWSKTVGTSTSPAPEQSPEQEICVQCNCKTEALTSMMNGESRAHMRVAAGKYLQPRNISTKCFMLSKREIFEDPEVENPQTVVNDLNFFNAVLRRAVDETDCRSVKGHSFHRLIPKIKELVPNIDTEDKVVMKKLKEKVTNVIHYLKRRQASPDREFKKRKIDYDNITPEDVVEKPKAVYKTGDLVTLLDYKEVPIAKAKVVAYPCTDLFIKDTDDPGEWLSVIIEYKRKCSVLDYLPANNALQEWKDVGRNNLVSWPKEMVASYKTYDDYYDKAKKERRKQRKSQGKKCPPILESDDDDLQPADDINQPATQSDSQPVSQHMHDVKPVAKQDVQPVDQSDVQSDPQPVDQSNVMPDPQPVDQSDVQPDSQPVAHKDIQPVVKPAAQPLDQSDTQPAVQPVAQSDVHPDTQPVAQLDVQPAAEQNAQQIIVLIVEVDSQVDTQLDTQLDNQSDVQQVAKPETQPDTQPGAETSIQPVAQSDVQQVAQLDAQPFLLSGSQLNDQPDVQLDVQPAE